MSPARHRPLLGLAIALLAAACATPRLTVLDLVDELADADVVFLGEIHDNDVGHVQQLQILSRLYAERKNLVLALEMFERDVQPVLDEYLAGDIDEQAFLAEARPWRSYATHYRPLVEFAKAHGLPVIASNAPTAVARAVARGEEIVREHVAAESTAPRDAYWERFVEAMGDHAGVDDDTMYAFYCAQCLKDDTMAESIVRALDAAPAADAAPLVVHVNGAFHSKQRLGIVPRLLARRPGLRVEIVDMRLEPNVVRDDHGYVLVVPPQPGGEGDEADEVDGAESAEPGA